MIYQATIHQASIFFDVSLSKRDDAVAIIDRICEMASKLGAVKLHNVRVSTDIGGPCWGPSIVVSSDDSMQQALKIATRIESYAKRFKGIQFYQGLI